MMKTLSLLLLLSASLSAQITPGMTTAQIQSALNAAPNGSPVTFAAGTYNIAPLTVPCKNLALTGPVSSPPTAVLAATTTSDSILSYAGNCSSLGSIKYMDFEKASAVYFGIGSNSNFDFEFNSNGNLPSNVSGGNNTIWAIGLFFDGNASTTLSNINVQHNTFGDPNSCTSVFASSTDMGGYCAGVLVSAQHVTNMTIDLNKFIHLEEGIHFFPGNYAVGSPATTCVSVEVAGNYIPNYHRIGTEVQCQTPTNPFVASHNVIIDPLNSSYGTYALSVPCCQWGNVYGTVGAATGLITDDNVLIASQPCGSGGCPPYGVEFWGNGSQGTNSLVEGTFSNGYTWGYGGGSWAINSNTICGPNYVNSSGSFYISNQQHQNNPPTQTGNVTGPTCQAITSTAPVISPAGGTFTGTQTVTLSDTGRNTGIWYTLDGSAPVPGSGTATRYTNSFTLSASATVKAVGMWGNSIQPTSYPAGYGYVPSAVVSATFTSGTAPPVNPPIIINLPPQTIPPQTIPARTLTCTPNAQGSYDCTSN